MVTIAIYIVVALAIFVVGYFVGSNNPLPSVKAKIEEQVTAKLNGAATNINSTIKKIG